MKERIKKFIEFKGISAGELSTLLDVQRSNISHILNGRNKPGAAFIEKLLLTFTDLNARWLLTGQGEMTYGPIKPQSEVANTIPFNIEAEVKDKVQQETKPVESLSEKISKEPKDIPSINTCDKVKKMILLYNDGTFETFRNRDKEDK